MTLRSLKEYMDTDKGTEGSLLFPKKIFDRLIQEVDKILIPRSEAALFLGPGDIPGSSVDVDLEQENKMKVNKIGQGASIFLQDEEYTSVNFKPSKYGIGLRITSEFVEDNQFQGIVGMAVKKAAKRFAENETSLILARLQAASSAVSGGAAITITNITTAMQNVEDNDYTPTTLLVGNEVLNDLRNIDTFVEANKVGNTEMIQRGFLGVIYGLNVLRFSTNAAPSTTYKKYAYVYDRTEAYGIAEKRPITIKGFNIETHDMTGVAITQRIVVKTLRDNAISRITTT